jgi:rRNA maturation endonuclease Nob1
MNNYKFQCEDCEAEGLLEVDAEYAEPSVCPVCGTNVDYKNLDEDE